MQADICLSETHFREAASKETHPLWFFVHLQRTEQLFLMEMCLNCDIKSHGTQKKTLDPEAQCSGILSGEKKGFELDYAAVRSSGKNKAFKIRLIFLLYCLLAE